MTHSVDQLLRGLRTRFAPRGLGQAHDLVLVPLRVRLLTGDLGLQLRVIDDLAALEV